MIEVPPSLLAIIERAVNRSPGKQVAVALRGQVIYAERLANGELAISSEKKIEPLPAPRHDPAEWGPKLWAFYHAEAERLETPEERFALVKGVPAQLPSGSCQCRKHWLALVEASPPQVDSREEFVRWWIEAHDSVNRRLGKPEFVRDEASLMP